MVLRDVKNIFKYLDNCRTAIIQLKNRQNVLKIISLDSADNECSASMSDRYDYFLPIENKIENNTKLLLP